MVDEIKEEEIKEEGQEGAEEGKDGEGEPSGKVVPLENLQAVQAEKIRIEGELKELKDKPGVTKEEVEDKEQKAEKYLETLVGKVFDKREQAAKENTTKEENQFETDVNNVLSIHTDVKRDDFVKFIEEKGEKYHVTSVEGAMQIYRDINKLTGEAKEEGKKDADKWGCSRCRNKAEVIVALIINFWILGIPNLHPHHIGSRYPKTGNKPNRNFICVPAYACIHTNSNIPSLSARRQ